MSKTQMPDLEKESKVTKKNVNFIIQFIKNNPIFILCLIIILMILFIGYSIVYSIPFSDRKLSIVSIYSLSLDDKYINDLIFSFDKEVNDWEINKSYEFSLVVRTNTTFYGKVIIYFRPYTENGLKSPTVGLSKSSFKIYKEKLNEIEGKINTTNSDYGRYNICVIIKDNAGTGYIKEFCDLRQIHIQ